MATLSPSAKHLISQYESLKEKSPIRQSLRNLLSVFKKGPKTADPITSTIPKKVNSLLSPTTGSLLYLSRIPLPGQLDFSAKHELAWTVCNVTLDPASRKIHLSSFTSELQFVVHEINLSGCTDIRSLAVSHLSEREAKLLDEASVRSEGEIGKLRAFEICFRDGRPKERFAAKSVKVRAGWISAIWYIFLLFLCS